MLSTHLQEAATPVPSVPCSPFAPPPRLGVLLVHGIGDQKRGETLDWAGEPFYNWVKHWVEGSLVNLPSDKERVYLTDTYLVRQDPEQSNAPPFTRIGFAKQEGVRSRDDENWILAESWWAADFAPPTFNDLVPWGLSYGPWMLQRLLRLSAGRLWSRIRFTRHHLQLLQGPIFFTLSLILFILVGIFFHVFVVALLILAALPGLSAFVRTLQVHLAGWLGDAYLIATSPVSVSAMVTQIQDDMNWLLTAGQCQQIAIIAHSGGAPIAYQAVQEQTNHTTAPINRVILITYGSGQSKLSVMQDVLERRVATHGVKLPSWGPALRSVGLILVLLGAPDLVQALQSIGKVPLEATLTQSASFVLGSIILAYIAVREFLFDKHLEPFMPHQPIAAPWYDIYAIGDPVSDGRIMPDPAAAPAPPGAQIAPHSIEVDNLGSIAQDHSTYWTNAEQFLPSIVEIFDTQKVLDPGSVLTISPSAKRVLSAFHRRRKRRVTAYMVAGFFSLLLVPSSAVALGPKLALVSRLVLSTPMPFISGSLRILPLDTPVGSVVFAVVILAVVAALNHQFLLFSVWRSWSRKETNALFARTHEQAVQADPKTCLRDLNREATGFFALWLCTPVVLFFVFLILVPWLSNSFWVMEPWLPITVGVPGLFLITNTIAVVSNHRQVTRY